jgi:2-polyprenyl-3-methyl-5-hydroxy-6-metoxy-1,4-benzoquinol methylase
MSNADKASKYWDKHIKIHSKYELVNWLDSPIVLDALPKLDGKYNPTQWVSWSQERFGLKGLRRGLSIGCGDGTLEWYAMKLGMAECFDGIDVSSKSIQFAQQEASKEHLNINYYCLDLNKDVLPNKYDVIFAGSSLHHIENLEHLFAQVRQHLNPGGLFLINEFVGPNRFQWTDRQVAIINLLLGILPRKLKTTSSGELKPHFSRPSLEEMSYDPSEAVRSKDIIPLISKEFDIIYRLDYGGTILHSLLYSIVNNFDASNIRYLALLERLLIKTKILESDFCVIVSR